MQEKITVLNWGCGVQSTALGIMGALGDLPRPDVILHTDLHWESRATRQAREFYLRWFSSHGLEVVILDVGDIRRLGAAEHMHMPLWTADGAPLQRQCTREFKIRPARRYLRARLGYHESRPPHPPPGAVENWIGFSLDEWQRMKHSGVAYIANRFPLIERRITRNACADYILSHGLPLPVKSGCVGCPYTAARDWIRIRDQEPESWREALAFDQANRENPLTTRGRVTSEQLYVWRGCIPLGQVDLEREAERERTATQLPMLLCDDGACWS